MQSRIETKALVLTGLFSALTAIGAFIKLPMIPVALSLQTFFVLLSGLLLGPYYGCLSQVVYLIIGLLGLPVFVQGGGPMYVFQPTFGYLMAFPLAAFWVGKLSNRVSSKYSPGRRRTEFVYYLLINTSAILIIFFIGVTYLYFNLNFFAEKSITLRVAFVSGALVFLPGDAIKIFLVAFIGQKLKNAVILARPNQSH